MIQPKPHVRLEDGDDAPRREAGTDVPRAVRAFLRIVALYFIGTGAIALLVGGAVALGIFDPTALLHGDGMSPERAMMQDDLARAARFPMIGGALSLAFGAALYWWSRRLADLISS